MFEWNSTLNATDECEVRVTVWKRGEYQKLTAASCNQSSMYGSYGCSLAIDGNFNQIFTGQSCMHTLTSSVNSSLPWWSVRLDREASVQRLRIYNRGDCCEERLTHFRILVDNVVCFTKTSDTTFKIEDFECQARGTEIRIQQDENQYLHLCEVEAYGFY
jgi:hypothetical protein